MQNQCSDLFDSIWKVSCIRGFINTCVGFVTHSCPPVCYPMDWSPPGSSVPGILPARVLEWAVTSSSGVLLTQGSNPGPQHLLHRQGGSLSLSRLGRYIHTYIFRHTWYMGHMYVFFVFKGIKRLWMYDLNWLFNCANSFTMGINNKI